MTDRAPQPTKTFETFAAESSGPPAAASREELLAKVLSETLNRRDDQPATLISELRRWLASLDRSQLDEEFRLVDCEQLVRQVLAHRLGGCAADFPAQLHLELAQALWSNPDSKKRLVNFWNFLKKTS